MVILNLKMNNVLAFNDFEINFSYPVKLRKTLIPDENLQSKNLFIYLSSYRWFNFSLFGKW